MSDLSRILPVIDLKRGQVVHGVAGKRDSYQPIVSQIVDSPNPANVARALCDVVRGDDMYVADLDAIAGHEPDWNSYAAIANQDVTLWLDAGTSEVSSLRRIVEKTRNLANVIIALESLASLSLLETIATELSMQQVVFSLDLANGLPVTPDPSASNLSAEAIAAFAIAVGIRSIIVLDVAAVGRQRGATTIDLCRKIKARHSDDVQLISGGGVRDSSDVRRYVEAGCDRVLVATALHNRTITKD
jgi:HisA/HisF family protein